MHVCCFKIIVHDPVEGARAFVFQRKSDFHSAEVLMFGKCLPSGWKRAKNSCVSKIFAGGRGLQRHAEGNPPTHTPHCLQPPSQRLECMNGSNTINATFFSSPPSCEPGFTSLRISGNAMYVHVCKECVCVRACVLWKRVTRRPLW